MYADLRNLVLVLSLEPSEAGIRKLVLSAHQYDVFWLDVGMPTRLRQLTLVHVDLEGSYPLNSFPPVLNS